MQRARGKFDLLFIDTDRTVGFNLADGDAGRPSVVPFELSPGRTDQVVANADVARRIDNLDAGMGYSRRLEQVPNGYSYCSPGYTRAPGTIFMPAGKLRPITLPTAAGWVPTQALCSERFDGSIFLGAGSAVLQLSADGSSASVSGLFSAPFTSMVGGLLAFNNRLYAAGTAGGLAYLSPGGGAWVGPASGVYAYSLAAVSWRPLGIPTQVMLTIGQEFNQSALKWCPITADPMSDPAWSARVPIGPDRRYTAGPIVAAPRHAYVYARDGIYDLDELGTRAFNIAPWIGQAVDTTNGLFGIHVGSGLYYSHSQGLAFVPTTGETIHQPEWAQPGWGLPYEGPFMGGGLGITLHNGWGLGAFPSAVPGLVGGAQQSYLFAGRRDPGGPGGSMAYGQASHVWHGAEATVPGEVGHLRVYANSFAGGWPELLICSNRNDAGTGPGAWWQSLAKVGTPLQELIWGGHFQPADLSTLFLPADPWGQPSAVKQLLQIDLVADRLQLGSDYLKVLASTDGAAYVAQGTAEADVYTSLQPSPVLEGRYLSTRIDNFGSAVLRSIELRAALGLQLREARTYRLILAYDNALKSARSRETASPDLRMLDLQYLVGRVVQLDDGSAGAPYRVRVLQVATGERRRLGGPGRASANGTEGAWAVVVPVTVSFLDFPFRFDGPPTDRYDADRVYG